VTREIVTERGSANDLARLERERDEADRLYNEALTRLDAAIQKPSEHPHPPPPYDDFQVTPLNQRWELLPLKPDEGKGWLARIRAHAWAMVAPLFERQQAFNAALVDHINRNVAIHRETTRALETTLEMLRDDRQKRMEYQTLLILYAQNVTGYVDTKDRLVGGLMHTGLSALTEETQKHFASTMARDRRYEEQVGDVRSTLSVMTRAVQSMKRELESGSPRRSGEAAKAVAPDATAAGGAPPVALDSYKYVGFEDKFRGSQREIRERLAAYVPLFEGSSDVLDVGCGRGEFLDLLRERGISARGIDLNDEMAAVSRSRGLDATSGDALSYLLAQPDGSLGGLFAAQVVEHLEPDYLMRFLDTAYHKLRPGSKIVLETINPACWFAFFSSYIRDITHVRPLHPDTLQYLLTASGFQKVTVRYSAPFPDELKLQTAPGEPSSAAEQAIHDNVKTLNALLFTYLDYAAIGERL